MAERITIARPYAKAAFAEAQNDKLEVWSQALATAAAVAADARVKALLARPGDSLAVDQSIIAFE